MFGKKLKLIDNGFILKSSIFKREIVTFANVNSVLGIKIDKITYEEFFLKFDLIDNNCVVVGEFDDNFNLIEQKLLQQFKNFPENWRVIIDTENSPNYIKIWKKNEVFY